MNRFTLAASIEIALSAAVVATACAGAANRDLMAAIPDETTSGSVQQAAWLSRDAPRSKMNVRLATSNGRSEHGP